MKIAILDDYLDCALSLGDWSRLPGCDVSVFCDPIPVDERAAVLAPFDVLCLMRDRMPMPRSLIEQLPNLKFISFTGPSNLALDGYAAAERGIVMSGTGSPNGLAEHFEFIWALIMATVRNIPANDAGMREGAWQTSFGRALHGRTIGILGLGNFGAMVADMAARFGMKVVAWSHNMTEAKAASHGARLASFNELLATSDIVTIHLRLSERTHHLIDGPAFARMKRDAVLINTSRGPIVDEGAMIEALQTGRIARAGLDVFDEEPLPTDSVLRTLPNVVLSPHLGFSTEGLLRSFHQQSIENVAAWLDGAPIRIANGDTVAGLGR
ncbi:MAG: D-2-hydroxyacid dehydrogenase family protein [Sphingobium sp.]